MIAALGVLASAGLYALSFPPFSLRLGVPLALAVFFACAGGAGSWRRAAALGWLWAIAATIGVTWWFPRMLARYFELGPAASVLGLLALGALVVGPSCALFAAWLARVAARGRAGPFAIAAGWCAAELLRSHGPLAAPWALSGYALFGTTLAQAADLGGPWGLGALLAAWGAVLAGLVVPALRPRRPLASALGVGVLLAAAFVYGRVRLSEDFALADDPVSVAVIQGGVTYAYHFDPARSAPNLAQYIALTERAAQTHPQLVVWPEHAIDFYLRDASAERAELLSALAPLGLEVVLGAPHYERADGGGEDARYRNAVFAVDGGAVEDRVDKARLVPLAELSPLGVGGRYEAGGARRPLRTRAAPLGVVICSEALFPEAARELADGGAELLVHPSNDFWMGAAAGAEAMLQAASFRAIEQRRTLVRATPTGVSAFVDAHGRVLGRAAPERAEVLTAALVRSRSVTPYARLGDTPWWLLALAAAAPALAPPRRAADRSGP